MLLAIMSSHPCFAETFRIDTPSGELITEYYQYPAIIRVGQVEFKIDAGEITSIGPRDEDEAKVAAAMPNHFLINVMTGGTVCPTRFYWLNADGGEPQLSKEFGGCFEESYGDLRVEDGLIKIRQIGNGIQGNIDYVYDGADVTEVVAGLDSTDDFNPFNPKNWRGEHVFHYVSSAEIEPVLMGIMPNDALSELRHAVRVGGRGEFTEKDGWLTASGCRQSMCDVGWAIVSINIETGKPYIALKDFSQKNVAFFGEAPGEVPLEMRQELSLRQY